MLLFDSLPHLSFSLARSLLHIFPSPSFPITHSINLVSPCHGHKLRL